MLKQSHRSVWNAYERVWHMRATDEREMLLRQTVGQDCFFSNMAIIGRGRDQLASAIEQFQGQYPGARFATTEYIEQHEQSLAQWNLHDAKGVVILSGANYTQYGEDGLIRHIAGFWGA